MSSVIPFQIPVAVYQGAVGPTAAVAPWVESLTDNALAGASVCVLYNNFGSDYAGLYILSGTRWLFVAPYAAVNGFIISGGKVSIYLDPTAPVTPEAGASVYRNGVLSTATTLAAGNIVWATIYVEPASGYTLPVATASVLGGVKQGTGVTIAGDGTLSVSGGASGANPTGTVGLAAVNGVATTFMRSDAAPPLSVAITPTWTGLHTFSGGVTATGAINLTGGTVTVPTIAGSTDSTTSAASTAFVQAVATSKASTTTPVVDGTAAVGVATTFARADHVHPTDASRAPLASPSFTGTVSSAGQVSITTAGSGLTVRGGTNAKIGTATLASGVATVANTSVTANSRIFLTVQNGTATTGSVSVGTITAGTSFTIVSSNTGDATTVAYFIVEQD
jgi:hypothetical protein